MIPEELSFQLIGHLISIDRRDDTNKGDDDSRGKGGSWDGRSGSPKRLTP